MIISLLTYNHLLVVRDGVERLTGDPKLEIRQSLLLDRYQRFVPLKCRSEPKN